MIAYYFLSPQVTRSMPYGRKPRQRLDLYTPSTPACSDSGGHPVVVFVTGGAWTIGYKAWGSLLGRRLAEAGVMCACLDYRNFPQGSALDMLEDVNTGIAWVVRKIERHGGDPDAIYLVGQSAGGQLSLLALLNQAAQAAAGEAVLGAAPVWHPADIKAYVGVSGAFDLEGLAEHLHARGLYRGLLDSVMSIDGRVAYELLSPLHAARTAAAMRGGRRAADQGAVAASAAAAGGAAAAANGPHHTQQQQQHALVPGRAAPVATGIACFLPEVLLVHGMADKSVPYASSVRMADALRAAGVAARCVLLHGKTHTDLLLEDALAGGRDVLAETILAVVARASGGGSVLLGPDDHSDLAKQLRSSYPSMCPRVLVRLAGRVCPF